MYILQNEEGWYIDKVRKIGQMINFGVCKDPLDALRFTRKEAEIYCSIRPEFKKRKIS